MFLQNILYVFLGLFMLKQIFGKGCWTARTALDTQHIFDPPTIPRILLPAAHAHTTLHHLPQGTGPPALGITQHIDCSLEPGLLAKGLSLMVHINSKKPFSRFCSFHLALHSD